LAKGDRVRDGSPEFEMLQGRSFQHEKLPETWRAKTSRQRQATEAELANAEDVQSELG
jgi:hypothetical protein